MKLPGIFGRLRVWFSDARINVTFIRTLNVFGSAHGDGDSSRSVACRGGVNSQRPRPRVIDISLGSVSRETPSQILGMHSNRWGETLQALEKKAGKQKC